jgi:hypothetical protein
VDSGGATAEEDEAGFRGVTPRLREVLADAGCDVKVSYFMPRREYEGFDKRPEERAEDRGLDEPFVGLPTPRGLRPGKPDADSRPFSAEFWRKFARMSFSSSAIAATGSR